MTQELWHEDGEEKKYQTREQTTLLYNDWNHTSSQSPEGHTNAPRSILTHEEVPVATSHEISDHVILEIPREIPLQVAETSLPGIAFAGPLPNGVSYLQVSTLAPSACLAGQTK